MKSLSIIFTIIIITVFTLNGATQNVLPTDKAKVVYSTLKMTNASSTTACKNITLESKQNNVDCIAIMNDGTIQDENSKNISVNVSKKTQMTSRKDLPEMSIVPSN